uniref:Uncharacterized protein n=1 Tax=Picea glauca TaxID=3330 RepID=A0A101M0B5_PICGL|nr:hypothetical protein ABT39_MTgene4679 [Picea glauca]
MRKDRWIHPHGFRMYHMVLPQVTRIKGKVKRNIFPGPRRSDYKPSGKGRPLDFGKTLLSMTLFFLGIETICNRGSSASVLMGLAIKF